MDAFRILARSTTHSRNSVKSSLALTPSAGEALNPQLFGDQSDQVDAPRATAFTQSRSNKRKRGENNDLGTIIPPRELDFFSDAPKAEHVGKTQAEAGITPKQTEQTEAHSYVDEDFQILPDEECKRILRNHKLKITQLWIPTPKGDGSKDRKKKRRREATSISTTETSKTHKRKLDIVPQPLTSFSQLRSRYDIPKTLARNIDAQGYTVPTEVQLGSLPLLLQPATTVQSRLQSENDPRSTVHDEIDHGTEVDLLAVAPTGSGKTLAFLIPVLNSLLRQRKSSNSVATQVAAFSGEGPKAIIVAPTKELAGQIVNEGRKLTRQTGIKVTLVRKGMQIRTNARAAAQSSGLASIHHGDSSSDDNSPSDSGSIARGRPATPTVKADVLVSTPLTLLHTITTQNGSIKPLSSVKYLVLDEADVLLDDLFRDQTLQIWSACTSSSLRVSLWSATMGSSIEDLAKSTIEARWTRLSVRDSTNLRRPRLLRLVVGLKDSAIPNVHHKLVYAATEQGKLIALRQLLRPSGVPADASPVLRPPFLVFTQTIPRAIALHSELLYDIPEEAGGSTRIAVLHADLSDSTRERVMTRFRKGEIWVLITTDLLSRGVDFRGVNGVVNYDFPNSSAAYVHRVGRTGRAGRAGGVAVTLYAKEDIPFVKNVANVIAASERQKGGNGMGEGLQQWLLDALPRPSKRDKQQLKKRGIESRRPNNVRGTDGTDGAMTRISTKSGFDRRMENNRRGAVQGGKVRKGGEIRPLVDNNDFSGFEDED